MNRYLLLLFPVLLSAQIEIDVVEVEAEPVQPEGGEAPELRGHGQPAGRTEEALIFLNENELAGTLLDVTEEGLLWRHPDAEEPIRFSTGNLKAVELKIDSAALSELLELPRIELTNGDILRARIMGLDNGELRLESPCFGSATVQTRMITALYPNAVSTTLYEGPSSEEEWEFHNLGGGNSSWMYREGALYADDRNLVAAIEPGELPERYTLSFDLEWKGMLNFNLGFWAKNTQNPNSNAYVIALQNNYLRAYRNYNNLGRNNFVNQQIQQQLKDGSVSFTLHLDRSSKQMVFLLDGVVLGQWRDVFDGDIRGDKLLFYTQVDSAMRITNIRIQDWDGELKTGEESGVQSRDRLTTTTGDEFAGEVLEIERGVLRFQNEFADFQVPLERVGEIRFDSESRAEPRLMEGDVKISSAAGEVITLDLDQIEAGVLSGGSESTGRLDLRLRYFSEIQFNPYDDRHQQDRFAW